MTERGENMLYKVWGQNCVRPKGQRIIEASEKDLDEAYEAVMNEALIQEYIDITKDDDEDEIDYDKQDAAYSKISKYFDENKCIDCGDYRIVDAEDKDDICIPNVCGNSAWFIW